MALGFAIIGVIVINVVFSFWQEYRAERTIAALQQFLPPQVKVLRAGKALEETASELVHAVAGDRYDVSLALEHGDNPPSGPQATRRWRSASRFRNTSRTRPGGGALHRDHGRGYSIPATRIGQSFAKSGERFTSSDAYFCPEKRTDELGNTVKWRFR
jgi:hypothetical protein